MSCVSEVFGPSFKYGRQWLSDDGLEWLEFEADVGHSGKVVHGIDLVSLCEETSRIKEFTVLARPPNAVAALKTAMMQRVPVRLAKLRLVNAGFNFAMCQSCAAHGSIPGGRSTASSPALY